MKTRIAVVIPYEELVEKLPNTFKADMVLRTSHSVHDGTTLVVFEKGRAVSEVPAYRVVADLGLPAQPNAVVADAVVEQLIVTYSVDYADARALSRGESPTMFTLDNFFAQKDTLFVEKRVISDRFGRLV